MYLGLAEKVLFMIRKKHVSTPADFNKSIKKSKNKEVKFSGDRLNIIVATGQNYTILYTRKSHFLFRFIFPYSFVFNTVQVVLYSAYFLYTASLLHLFLFLQKLQVLMCPSISSMSFFQSFMHIFFCLLPSFISLQSLPQIPNFFHFDFLSNYSCFFHLSSIYFFPLSLISYIFL